MARYTGRPGSAILAVMAKRKKYRTTFIREWRKHRNLTIEKLATRIGMTTSNLSKTERGAQAYTQPVLEAVAEELNCSPADLIMRPPHAGNELLTLISALEKEQQEQAVAVIKALTTRSAA